MERSLFPEPLLPNFSHLTWGAEWVEGSWSGWGLSPSPAAEWDTGCFSSLRNGNFCSTSIDSLPSWPDWICVKHIFSLLLCFAESERRERAAASSPLALTLHKQWFHLVLFHFGKGAFRLELVCRGRIGREGWIGKSLCGCCREQLESSCAGGAEVGFLHVLKLCWCSIHGEADVVGCPHHWLLLQDGETLVTELGQWLAEGQQPQADPGGWKQNHWVCQARTMGDSPGARAHSVSGWPWCDSFVKAGILTSGNTSHRHW